MINLSEIIRIENLIKSYGNRALPALSNVSFKIQQGEIICVTGVSGSGKSTLLASLAAFLPPTSGKVFYYGNSIWDMSYKELLKLRANNVGYAEQSFRLISVLNAYENIILPLKLNNKAVNKNYVNNLIERLRLNECINRFPHELSGGESQRVALAQALAINPTIIIADEPTNCLDEQNKTEVMKMLYEMNSTENKTVIYSTHDEAFAKAAKRIIVLSDGHVVSDQVKRKTCTK